MDYLGSMRNIWFGHMSRGHSARRNHRHADLVGAQTIVDAQERQVFDRRPQSQPPKPEPEVEHLQHTYKLYYSINIVMVAPLSPVVFSSVVAIQQSKRALNDGHWPRSLAAAV